MAGTRVIGVDLGGTKIYAGLVDEDGTVERTLERPTPLDSQENLLAALVEIVRELKEDDVAAVGIGVPARVDQRTGAVLGAVNIPLHDLNFRAEMREWLGLPVSVDNDASAAALAEHRVGAGQGVSDLVLLTLGTGVGGGVVTGGRLYRAWAELGHMVIVEDGEPCQGACTGRGHVESYCSGSAVDRIAHRELGPDADAHDLVRADHPALTEVGGHLGTAIGSVVNLFGPQVVVIGGGFGHAAFDRLVEPARKVAAREALPSARDVPIVRAQLGLDAGMIGAALAARDTLESGARVPLAVCATPIGNLDDVTLRVLAELREADVVLAEDTRHTRSLLARHGIEARLLSYHEHNEAARVAQLVPRLVAGERVALVSDAGMPGVSDPGARLVRAALEAGVVVTVLPGPSAVETALVASGLVDARFAFIGFLPRREGERVALWAELASWTWPAVAFESAQRLGASLRSLAAVSPEREVAVCRELTKRFEEVARGSAVELADRFAEPPKGEITIVIGPAVGGVGDGDRDRAVAAVAELVAAGTPRRVAADVVGRLTNMSRNDLYRGSL